MRPVAFFDIDGTVFRSSLLVELVEQLIKEDVFPPEAALQYEMEKQAWRAREGEYQGYIEAVVKSFLQYIKGVHYRTFVEIGQHVVAEQSKHVYRYTRDLIAQLKAQDYYLVAISQSPKTVLDEFCLQYGFDKVYGRFYEIGPQDQFTGIVTDEHLIKNKANIVNRVFDRNATLSREHSLAVGDTDGDISLLETVAQPICFNPNERLYTYAKRVGWPVIVERKDVIYTIGTM
ncbi:HAD-IB family phosphatase [Candidatus Kaiserbacteria bacterium]|nr:HAD-IB family phosphatase [Candidatus Kaiserbacteria bacterium]NCT01674.1 HAD-IB family phosphatase [Candidatus Parcubacteria bacterium]